MLHENLKGRVAVVTGGGGVLCGDFAKTLAKQGVKVAVLDLNEAAAQKVADEIERQLKLLPREDIARTSVDNNGKIFIILIYINAFNFV